MHTRSARSRAFSITEVLVVIGVLVVLLGLLFPALSSFVRSGKMTKSMSNMRQIATWMTLYSEANRDLVVPSQFNYAGNLNPGKARSEYNLTCGQQFHGTWTDILWTQFEVGFFLDAVTPLGIDYRFDSPDAALYEVMAGEVDNPFRSAAANTRNTPGVAAGAPAKPFGPGAVEVGEPGYFAANNFFNADEESPTHNGWFAAGQIRQPERSMYLVDSFVGEVIEDDPVPFQVGSGLGGQPTAEVDFRYNGVCLMLFLDGHQETVGEWEEICELEGPEGRGIRIRELTRRSSDLCD